MNSAPALLTCSLSALGLKTHTAYQDQAWRLQRKAETKQENTVGYSVTSEAVILVSSSKVRTSLPSSL